MALISVLLSKRSGLRQRVRAKAGQSRSQAGAVPGSHAAAVLPRDPPAGPPLLLPRQSPLVTLGHARHRTGVLLAPPHPSCRGLLRPMQPVLTPKPPDLPGAAPASPRARCQQGAHAAPRAPSVFYSESCRHRGSKTPEGQAGHAGGQGRNRVRGAGEGDAILPRAPRASQDTAGDVTLRGTENPLPQVVEVEGLGFLP